MANITYNKLMQYKNYEFSTGCYTGEDYKIFERLYIRHLKAICKENNWIFVQANKNHYCMSAFIKDSNNRFIYLSISDVRFFRNEWCNNVLIRTASDEKDYHGGSNHYTTLQAFVQMYRGFLITNKEKTMTPYTVKARINSLRGKLEEVTIVDMFEENNQTIYIAEYKGKRCRTLFNWFVCTYYVDDIYGVINESKAQ